MSQRLRTRLWSGVVVLATLSLVLGACTPGEVRDRGEGEREREGEEESLREIAERGDRQLPILVVREKIGESGEAERFGGPAAEAYENRAIPRATIRFKQVKKAIAAAAAIPSGRSGLSAPLVAGWQELGPVTPTVPAIATYTDRATQNTGRVTSMAIAPTCVPGNCNVWVGAAGGGVWFTSNALAAVPSWQPLDDGITSNSIGSLAVDPNNPNRVLAGTGEPNGSGDSEAGGTKKTLCSAPMFTCMCVGSPGMSDTIITSPLRVPATVRM